jgi:hypothetical protein
MDLKKYRAKRNFKVTPEPELPALGMAFDKTGRQVCVDSGCGRREAAFRSVETVDV